MFCVKFGWNWISGSNRIIKFRQYILLFRYDSPLKRAGTSVKKNLEFHLPKDDFCRVWLKSAQWYWREKKSNFVIVFSLRFIFFLWKRGKFGLKWLSGPERWNVKSLQTDGQSNRQHTVRKAHVSSLLRWVEIRKIIGLLRPIQNPSRSTFVRMLLEHNTYQTKGKQNFTSKTLYIIICLKLALKDSWENYLMWTDRRTRRSEKFMWAPISGELTCEIMNIFKLLKQIRNSP